jgi:DNA-binding MurR/RpiR family transcriptional regulator
MARTPSLKSFIEELFSKNTDYRYPEQAINQAESLKSLSNDLYTDNIRFIYELIQNADDAQANEVLIGIFAKNHLFIAHNGEYKFVIYNMYYHTLLFLVNKFVKKTI